MVHHAAGAAHMHPLMHAPGHVPAPHSAHHAHSAPPPDLAHSHHHAHPAHEQAAHHAAPAPAPAASAPLKRGPPPKKDTKAVREAKAQQAAKVEFDAGELPPKWDWEQTDDGEVYYLMPDGET